MSVGTNDAAPWKHVPVPMFSHAVSRCVQDVPARRWVYVAPPGVHQCRSAGLADRTNTVLDDYRAAAIVAFHDAGARVVRTERVIAPLGASAFVNDGLHLSGRAYKVLLPAIAEAVHTTE